MKNLNVTLLSLALLLCQTSVAAANDIRSLTSGGVFSNSIERHHRGTFGGQTLEYRSLVESFALTPLADNPLAITSISYLVNDDATRPVLFAFNGGPISPAIYLHMMALGPKRLAVADDLSANPASFPLVNNPYSPLDAADIVLFDPAGTGYSQLIDKQKSTEYFGNVNDAKAFVAFVHAWLARHGRTDAPIYILGESYGTMRAAAAVQLLSEESSLVNLRGIYLFGQALNIVETAQRPDNIMTYVLSLKTLAALGWYHGKVNKQGRSLAVFLDQVGTFAEQDYLDVLLAGNRASEKQKQAVARQLAALTGVSASVQLDYNLRMSKNQFRTELLKAENLVLGGSDGRYTMTPEKPGSLADASAAIYPAIFKAFNLYAIESLGVNADLPYVTDSPVTNLGQWDWGSKAGPFGNWPYADGISAAFAKFPQLQLVLGVGYYDTLTTTGATEYLLQQHNWPSGQVMLRHYEGGHMAYTVEKNLQAFSQDLHQLIRR